MKTKLIFFGSTVLAAKVLEAIAAQYEIPLVVTQPDKPVGRTQNLKETAVAETAKKLGLSVAKPAKLKDPEFNEDLRTLQPGLYLVAAYGKIIPQSVLDIPSKGSINIHPSLLPKYRGPAPIITPILDGADKTGVTIMLMDAEMDHGPILDQSDLVISKNETLPTLEQRLTELSCKLILEVIPKYLRGEITAREQDHGAATYTKIITKEDGKIDWNKSALQIYNMYRAFAIWPKIWTTWKGKSLIISHVTEPDANPIVVGGPEKQKNPGQVFKTDKNIYVQTGEGALNITAVQLEGKKEVLISDFINGHSDFVGSTLS